METASYMYMYKYLYMYIEWGEYTYLFYFTPFFVSNICTLYNARVWIKVNLWWKVIQQKASYILEGLPNTAP